MINQSGCYANNSASGFSIIELMVSLAIVATLLSIAAPRFNGAQQTAKESVLRENLRVTRLAIDQFHSDKGVFPQSLQELTQEGYLRNIPLDPLTDSRETWVVVRETGPGSPRLIDIRSSSTEISSADGPYAKW